MNLEGAVYKQTKEAPSKIQIKGENPKVFERIFHNAIARVLDFLILFREYDYHESEIARRTGLTPNTVSVQLQEILLQYFWRESQFQDRVFCIFMIQLHI